MGLKPRKGSALRAAVGASLTTRRFQSVSRSQETEIRCSLPGNVPWKRFGNALKTPRLVFHRRREMFRATAVGSHIQIDASAVRWRRWEVATSVWRSRRNPHHPTAETHLAVESRPAQISRVPAAGVAGEDAPCRTRQRRTSGLRRTSVRHPSAAGPDPARPRARRSSPADAGRVHGDAGHGPRARGQALVPARRVVPASSRCRFPARSIRWRRRCCRAAVRTPPAASRERLRSNRHRARSASSDRYGSSGARTGSVCRGGPTRHQTVCRGHDRPDRWSLDRRAPNDCDRARRIPQRPTVGGPPPNPPAIARIAPKPSAASPIGARTTSKPTTHSPSTQ